jgi:hypothetical protein
MPLICEVLGVPIPQGSHVLAKLVEWLLAERFQHVGSEAHDVAFERSVDDLFASVGQRDPCDSTVARAADTLHVAGLCDAISQLGKPAAGEQHFVGQLRHGKPMIGRSYQPQQHLKPSGRQIGRFNIGLQHPLDSGKTFHHKSPVGNKIAVVHTRILSVGEVS